MDIRTDFKVSKTSDTSWAGVYGYHSDRPGVVKVFGEMFAVMSLQSAVKFDLNNLGGLLFDELQREYFQDGVTEVDLHHFEGALKAVKRRLEEILDREQELAETGVNFELAVVVLKEPAMYGAVIGESTVFVSRNGEMGEIGTALIDPDMDGFMRTGSMYIEEDDRILLTTSGFTGKNSESSLGDNLKSFNLDGVSLEGGAAALLVGYGVQVEEQPEAAPAPVPIPTPAEVAVTEIATRADTPVDMVTQAEAVEDEVLNGQAYDDELQDSPIAEEALSEDVQDEQAEGTQSKAKALLGRAQLTAGSILTGLQTKFRRGKSEKTQEFLESSESLEPPGLTDTEVESYSHISSGSVSIFGRIKDKVLQLVHQANNWFSTVVLRRGDRQQLYLRQKHGADRWRLLVLAAIVIVIVLFFGIRKVSQDREREASIQALQTQVGQLTNEYAQLELEATTASDSEQAESRTEIFAKLAGFREKVSAALASDPITSSIMTDLEGLDESASRSQDRVLKIYAFTEPQLINDLGANFAQAEPVDITYSEGNLYIVDKAKGTVYRTGTTLSSDASVMVADLVEPYAITTNQDGDLVVVDKFAESTIATIDLNTGAVRRHAGLSPSKQGLLADIDVWTNKSLYAVSPERKAIIRQLDFGGSYQLPDYNSPWRSDEAFANAIDFAVDFRIYVLIDGVGLKRYLSGNEEPFTLRGATAEDVAALANATAFEITDSHLYIAEPSGNRLLVFKKDINDAQFFDYVGQYVFRGEGSVLANVQDLVVNPAGNQLYTLDGSSVLRFDLNVF